MFKVGDNTFSGLVNIGKSGNKKTLYDITNIKRISQNRSTSANAFTTSLANPDNNNISQSDTNVKSNTFEFRYFTKKIRLVFKITSTIKEKIIKSPIIRRFPNFYSH